MNGKKEWVTCIGDGETAIATARGEVHPRFSRCGRYCFGEFVFSDSEHARLAVEQGSRMVPCQKCVDADTVSVVAGAAL